MIKQVTAFHYCKASKDGYRTSCKECNKITYTKYMCTFEGYITSNVGTIKWRSRTRNIPYTIDPQFIMQMFNDQGGRCKLSNRELTYGRSEEKRKKGEFMSNLSVDKIIPRNGYVRENVQLLCHSVNIIKGILTNNELIGICHIIKNRKQNQKMK
jgi:hypothetical protein